MPIRSWNIRERGYVTGGLVSYSFWIRGRPAAWITSIVFIIVGAAILLVLPSNMKATSDKELASAVVWILGVGFLLMGGLILCAMLVDLYLAMSAPHKRESYFWWVNFLAGIIGALLFAIPSTLVFPFGLIAYFLRPNAIFKAGSTDDLSNLLVMAFFSLAGVGTFALLYLVVKGKVRERP